MDEYHLDWPCRFFLKYGTTDLMDRLIVGIAGGTGSGKTTIARKIAQSLPENSVSTIEHDNYYRDRIELSDEERSNLNYDHPDSLETELLVRQLQELRAGQSVEMPLYDFMTHRRNTATKIVQPTPLIIVEGILVFVDASLRDMLDIKIFVDTDADIRIFRRIRRDMEQRGRSFLSVRDQYYQSVRPMHMKFVEPSKQWSDLIVPEGGNSDVALDLIVSKLMSVALESKDS